MRSIKVTTHFSIVGRILENCVASALFFCSCLGLVVAGCYEPVSTTTGSSSSPDNQQTGSSMEEKAIAIARQAIAGKVNLQKGAPVTVKRKGDAYVVTFGHILPPGTLGADYDAQVTINSATWEVIKVLAGS